MQIVYINYNQFIHLAKKLQEHLTARKDQPVTTVNVPEPFITSDEARNWSKWILVDKTVAALQRNLRLLRHQADYFELYADPESVLSYLHFVLQQSLQDFVDWIASPETPGSLECSMSVHSILNIHGYHLEIHATDITLGLDVPAVIRHEIFVVRDGFTQDWDSLT